MEIKGVNVFKVLAFQKVSRLLNDMTVDIRKYHEEGRLGEVEGIGGSSRKVIEEFIATGRSTDYEELAASVPAGLLPLLEIPGLGPKTINLFWKQRRHEHGATRQGARRRVTARLERDRGEEAPGDPRGDRVARAGRGGWGSSTPGRSPKASSVGCGN